MVGNARNQREIRRRWAPTWSAIVDDLCVGFYQDSADLEYRVAIGGCLGGCGCVYVWHGRVGGVPWQLNAAGAHQGL